MNIEKKIAWIFSILIILFSIYWLQKEDNKHKSIEENYKIVKGSFYDFKTLGSFQHPYLIYEYEVNYKKFRRSIRVPVGIFNFCESKPAKCYSKKFWVAYEVGNPANSLVNWKLEIQDSINAKVPNTLKGFE
jgi:hypothetical protein